MRRGLIRTLAVASGTLGMMLAQTGSREGTAVSQVVHRNAGERRLAGCGATLSPDSIPVSTRPVRVSARLSADIGTLSRVAVSEPSDLVILAVEPVNDSTVDVRLSASHARPGTWAMDFVGSEGQCRGRLDVTGTAEDVVRSQIDESGEFNPEHRRES